MPKVEFTEGVCALHGNTRFFIPPHHHYGETIVEAVARCVRRSPQELTLCAFPVNDLEVHGEHATSIILAVDAPNQQSSAAVHAARRDVFVFCDLRPIGLRPRFFRTHCFVVHMPSLLSAFNIVLHPSYRVEVAGGSRQGEDIVLTGHETLIFYPRKATAEEVRECNRLLRSPSSSSDSSLPSDHAEDSDGALDIGLALEPDLSQWDWRHDSVEMQLQVPNLEESSGATNTANLFPPGPRNVQFSDYESLCEQSVASGHAPAAAVPADTEVRGHPRAPPGTDTEGHEGLPVRVLALVFVPGYVPEMLHVSLHIPCGVEQAFQAVRDGRLADKAFHFPCLYTAQPHPVRDCAIMLAGPAWESDVAVVLLDCRPVNDVFFAAWAAKSLNRESLLLAAGFRATDTHHVFVHGLVQPLAAWQTIALFSGMVVTFTPAGVHSPATYDFPTMLLQQVDWSAHAEVPGAAHAPGVYFHVLTDAGAQMFAVGQWRRQQFREDLAAQLQTDDSALTIKPTAPRVVDHFDKGYISSGVVVATEQLSRLPFPPARRQEDRIIVVLECRRVLQGFLWILHRGPRLSLAEIAHRFEGRIALLAQAPSLKTCQTARTYRSVVASCL